jgi:hypothetical protein
MYLSLYYSHVNHPLKGTTLWPNFVSCTFMTHLMMTWLPLVLHNERYFLLDRCPLSNLSLFYMMTSFGCLVLRWGSLLFPHPCLCPLVTGLALLDHLGHLVMGISPLFMLCLGLQTPYLVGNWLGSIILCPQRPKSI